MAHNNVEVEIKTQLTKKKFTDLEIWLSKNAKFIKTSEHSDDYYTPNYKSFLSPKYPFEWLTVRLRDGKILMNYKHWYPEGIKDTTHCDEYETQVSDAVQLSKILKAIRFTKFITVAKTRKVFNVGNNDIEVALDKVKGLGYFIEVESLRDFGGIKKTHKMLTEFLHKVGIMDTHTVPGGYAAELMRRKGLVKA